VLLDWKSFLPGVRGSVMALAEVSPETVGAYRQVCAVGAKDGHLGAKTRELISLAVAVTTRSDGCIAAHTKAAIDLGGREKKSQKRLASPLP
jgi:AhpD family alkylhydroperoxidase